MKLVKFFTAACLAQAGLASAVPAVAHRKFHDERRDPAGPVVVTETVTLYGTLARADKDGKPICTQTKSDVTLSKSVPLLEAVKTADPRIVTISSQAPRLPVASQQPSRSTMPDQSPTSSSSNATSTVNSDNPIADTEAHASSGVESVVPGGMGICYDMIDSQQRCKDPPSMNSEFGFLKGQGYGLVRIYDIGCPLGDAIAAAGQQGMQLMIGINSINNLNADLGKLIDMVKDNWEPVHTVYIGNEPINQGHASAGQVAAAVTTARSLLSGAGYNGAVVTVDAFGVMQDDPTACSTSDYCAVNAHAYFDPNTSADKAASFVINAYNAVADVNNGKSVVITESGWPYAGNCNGAACPSPENQKTAVNGIVKSFAGMPGNLYLFQAYNAGYKSGGDLGVETHFGIYDQDHYHGGIGSP